MVDVFVYVVVLNLFVEYLPPGHQRDVHLVAAHGGRPEGVLEVVVAAKDRVKTRFRQAASPGDTLSSGISELVTSASPTTVRAMPAPGVPSVSAHSVRNATTPAYRSAPAARQMGGQVTGG